MKKIFAMLLIFASFLTCAYAKSPFSEYISTAFDSGIISGNENGDFEEDKLASRAEFAMLLTKFLNLRGGINVFSDVAEGVWYEGAFAAASYRGLIFGYNGMAMPQNKVTFEDAVTVIGRYYKAEKNDTFNLENVSDYAKPYFKYAIDNGIFTEGINTEPKHYATKGEILALLYNYDNKVGTEVRFVSGYPRLSDDNKYGLISIDIRTNKPCSVYYGIQESGTSGYSNEEKLCEIEYAAEIATINVEVDVAKTYDIYLRAMSEEGTLGRFAVIENLKPFSIKAGSGTAEKPYIIQTGEQLSQIALNPASHYKLGADIEITEKWKSIPVFLGTLDGNGFKISGLEITDDSDGAGLIKVLSGVVKNLTVDAKINVKHTAGAVCGTNDGGTVEGCSVTGEIKVKTGNAGGICGINKGTVKNCLSAMYSVTAGSYAGGICGQNFGNIENCLAATETVVSDMSAGGVAGANNGGTVTSCVSACMTVYDTMTKNSGRITTNKKNGITKNNYCYNATVTNASYVEESEFSQNGYDASWEEIESLDFYKKKLGWSGERWKLTQDGFRLIFPKNTKEPLLEAGKTAYLPQDITTEAELRAVNDNEAGHYILKKDITLTLPWKTICARDGFSGTFNGNGHTIYNLNLKGETGLFSNITGGTVKNLTLRNVTAMPASAGAVLAACNFGYIRNCNIYGQLATKKTGFLGTVAGENYGEISGCSVGVSIDNTFNNATIGGICAENNGIVINCEYRGKIESDAENAVIGGICGYNNGGYVYECFSRAEISAKNTVTYAGGICGIGLGAQVYKCTAAGRIVAECKDIAYIGGTSGMSEGGIIYNSFAVNGSYVSAESGYLGGICGFGSGAIIQNTYSASELIGVGNVSAGGICGFSESGFVMQNVALNPAINAGGSIGGVIGGEEQSEVSDNFSCNKMLINDKRITESAVNGAVKPIELLKNSDFYFKPIASGGSLGWGNEKSGEDIWTTDKIYKFPVLSGVKGQTGIKMPTYR